MQDSMGMPIEHGARLWHPAPMKAAFSNIQAVPGVLSVLFVLTLGIQAACALDEAEFNELHGKLKPAGDEAWRTLPWRLSVLEARSEAGQARKPVYMLVRSGHPLGCV